jgi:hypothetical protein
MDGNMNVKEKSIEMDGNMNVKEKLLTMNFI